MVPVAPIITGILLLLLVVVVVVVVVVIVVVVGVDGWIILRWISRRWDVGMWTGLGWPRIETGGVRL